MICLCPVCNGMEPFDARCPQCGEPIEDQGKFNDFLGPYAPYRAVDDISITNGFADLSNGQCLHVGYCYACGKDSITGISCSK